MADEPSSFIAVRLASPRQVAKADETIHRADIDRIDLEIEEAEKEEQLRGGAMDIKEFRRHRDQDIKDILARLDTRVAKRTVVRVPLAGGNTEKSVRGAR